MNIKIGLILLMVIFLNGCITNLRSEGTVSQENEFDPQRISGVYENADYEKKREGSKSGSVQHRYLSEFIFPSLTNHDEIDRIKVDAGAEKVTVSALNNNVQIYKKEFVEGKHYHLKGNSISIDSKLGCFGCSGQGAFHFGLSKLNYSLYLSTEGDAILRHNEKGVAVIVILPVPLLLEEEFDYLFKRIE